MSDQPQKKIGIFGIIAILVVVGWLVNSFNGDDDGGSSDTTALGGARPEPARPGSPDVYRRIASLTNCAKLQREFDIAADNADRLHDAGGTAPVPLAYMDAADDRMRSLGCYG